MIKKQVFKQFTSVLINSLLRPPDWRLRSHLPSEDVIDEQVLRDLKPGKPHPVKAFEIPFAGSPKETICSIYLLHSL